MSTFLIIARHVGRWGAIAVLLCCAAACETTAKQAADTPRPKPLADPPDFADIDDSIRRGVNFLVDYQNPNGSWGSATQTKGLNIYAPIPGAHHGFRTATTSLCLAALIEAGDDRSAVNEAIDKAEAWLLTELPRLRRATMDAIYNTWGHAYAIQALVRMLDRHRDDPDMRAKIMEQLESQVDMLARYEFTGGGWGYYDFEHHLQRPGGNANSFVSATVLIAFHEAQQAGVKIPQRLIDRGIAVVQRQRKPDNTYLYSASFQYYTMRGINRPGGSLGRSQACNAALRTWGDSSITDDVLSEWLDRLIARNGWLDIGRKRPVPHEAWFAVAGYFYYYGHYYAGYCIDLLPPDRRPHHQQHLAATIIALQETDGSWWDYPLYDYHKPYGTAYALMTLKRCLPRTAEAKPQVVEVPAPGHS